MDCTNDIVYDGLYLWYCIFQSLDAVVVVSPTNTHTDYICESLKHGVYCL